MATMQGHNFPTIAIVIAFGLCFFSMAALADEGTATFYTPPYLPSACNGFTDEGVMIAAASDAFWNGGGACGSTYKVTCLSATNDGVPHPCSASPSVVVTIVDYCPSGCQGTIDLSQEAFASIANPDAGKINVQIDRL